MHCSIIMKKSRCGWPLNKPWNISSVADKIKARIDICFIWRDRWLVTGYLDSNSFYSVKNNEWQYIFGSSSPYWLASMVRIVPQQEEFFYVALKLCSHKLWIVVIVVVSFWLWLTFLCGYPNCFYSIWPIVWGQFLSLNMASWIHYQLSIHKEKAPTLGTNIILKKGRTRKQRLQISKLKRWIHSQGKV